MTALGVALPIGISAQVRAQETDILRPAQSAAAQLGLDAVTAQSALRVYAIERSPTALARVDSALAAVASDRDALSRSLEACPEQIRASGSAQVDTVTGWLRETLELRSKLAAGGADARTDGPDATFEAVRTGGANFTQAIDDQIATIITTSERLLTAAVVFLAVMCLVVAWFVRLSLRRAGSSLVAPLGRLRDAMGSQTGGARGSRLTTDSPVGAIRDLTVAYNRLVDQSDQFERAHERTMSLVNAGLTLCSNLRGIESVEAALTEAARHTANVLLAERATVFGRDPNGTWCILWHVNDGQPQIPQLSEAAIRQVARDFEHPRRRLTVVVSSTDDPGDEMHLPMLQALRSLGVRHILTAPVWYDDVVFGVLTFTRGAKHGEYVEREVALAKHLAEQTAFALAAKFGTRSLAQPRTD